MGAGFNRQMTAPVRWGIRLLPAVALVTGVVFSFWMTSPDIDTDPHGAARAATGALGQAGNWLYIVALVALPFVLLSVYAWLGASRVEGWSLAGLVFSLASTSMLLVALAGSALASIVAGDLYLNGNEGAMAVFKQLSGGSFGREILIAFAIAVVLSVAGGLAYGVALWRSGLVAHWVAVAFGLGFVLLVASVPFATQLGDVLLLVAGIALVRATPAGEPSAAPAGVAPSRA